MDVARQGQRLLMALTSENNQAHGSDSASAADGILVTICGIVSLIFVAALCVCGERKPKLKENQEGLELNNVEGQMDEEALELRIKSSGDGTPTAGEKGSRGSAPAPGHSNHSRQASSSSGPPTGIRPTSLRELPQPPVSARHSCNVAMSAMEAPSMPESVHTAGEREVGDTDVMNDDYAYPKHVSPAGAKGSVKIGGGDAGKIKSHSDGYDHLGQRPQEKPINYDRLIPGKQEDSKKSPSSETDQETEGIYSLSKEEDPYNRIGDSDGGVPMSLIVHLRQSSDLTDPYTTVEEGSAGDLKFKSTNSGVGSSPSGKSQTTASHETRKEQNDYEDTDGEEEPEYAVVHKTRGNSQRRPQDPSGPSDRGSRASHGSSEDNAVAGAMPPEPPRLYNPYEDGDEEDETYSATDKPEHKYSMVTARESLASMSARRALNPYELVQDVPENMYATVEGGSGDGVVIRHMDSDDNNSNRNSQNSDTYAEIGSQAWDYLRPIRKVEKKKKKKNERERVVLKRTDVDPEKDSLCCPH
ncbi:hypothetical protein ElyMa_004724700 [Elysia marginata]|uniref:Uncharacterized protein n=1 Tax=Elysia marginata TaxID=1093978 RepID=A0AAV4IC57_9GAST|nr:hypothetical protein ElyMa_004724700 [Elysia marginata]